MQKTLTDEERIAAVDALLNRPAELPPPVVRARLRNAAGLTQPEVAKALHISRVQFSNWETGKATPYPSHRTAYAHLLRGLAERYPDSAAEEASVT